MPSLSDAHAEAPGVGSDHQHTTRDRRNLIAGDVTSARQLLNSAWRYAQDEAITDTTRDAISLLLDSCGDVLTSLQTEQSLDEGGER